MLTNTHSNNNRGFFSTEAFQEAMIASSQDCIKVMDLNAKLLFMNKGGISVTECDFEEIVGACWLDFWEGESKQQALTAFGKAKAGSIGEFVSFGKTPKSGTSKWWHTTMTLIHENNGKSEWILAVSRDVTRIKTLEQDMRIALHARDELMSICGHELKNPLTTLNLQLEVTRVALLKDGRELVESSEVKRMVDGYQRQIDRMSRLVEDMLDVTSMNSGKFRFTYQKVNFSELIKDVVQRFSEQLSVAKCNVTISVEQNLEGFWDFFRIEQVLINIIANAIKYGPGKPIIVNGYANGSKVYFSVEDQGLGIAEENLSRIFQRYERANGSSESKGLGLGLYIAKQIIDAHAGTINVHSQTGKGTTFIVELPKTEVSQ